MPACKPRSIMLATLGVLCLVSTPVIGAASTAGSGGRAAVGHPISRVIPAAAGQLLSPALAFPPDTAFCRQRLNLSCYSPAQYRAAYDLDPLYAHGITGRGMTIAVVDSFGSPTLVNDVHVFDQQFGLPDPPSLRIIQPAGPVPPFDPADDTRLAWASETTLDVDWAHAVAPGADILVVETPVAETEGVTGLPEIVRAENYVIDHGLADVISQSFGATENTFPSTQSLLDLRSAILNAARHRVTMIASSGDTGVTNYTVDGNLYPVPVNSWPSSDPLVTSLGGTQLHLDDAGNRTAPDNVWNDDFGAAGGGLSQVFGRPDYQDGVRSVVGNHRGTPDVSMTADFDGGGIFYWSYNPARNGWFISGGTSMAAPMFAGIVALAGQLAHHRLGLVNPALYRLHAVHSAGLVDITAGNISFGGVTGPSAAPGYDLASGLGTVDAARLVPRLALASWWHRQP